MHNSTAPLLDAALSELRRFLGKEVTVSRLENVYGGDINQSMVVHTNHGRFFCKSNPQAAPGFFQAERAGLELLRARSPLRIPQVVGTGEETGMAFLLLEYIEPGKPAGPFWQRFGEGLAAQHRCSNAYFGLDHHNYIGSLRQLNTPAADWPAFFAQYRLLPLCEEAAGRGLLHPGDLQHAESLVKKLSDLFPAEPPALLHGDLWSGNFLADHRGEPVLIDPAVYYGHREMDLAMSLLFGGFDESFYEAYHHHYPLEKNWRQRIRLCQLYPLLVHLLLFGGHYQNAVTEVLGIYA